MSDRDIDVKELAQEVVGELETGSYGNKFVLSRRQLMAIAGGGLSMGALASLGVTEAQAQEAVGQIGSPSERVDIFANALDADSATINERNLELGELSETNEIENTTALGGSAIISDQGQFENSNGNTVVGESVVIGTDSEVTHPRSIALGHDAKSEHADTNPGGDHRVGMAIGWRSYSLGHSAHAIGHAAEATATRATSLGRRAICRGQESICIGYDAEVPEGQTNAVVIGAEASADDGSVAIGHNSSGNQSTIVLGREATAGPGNTSVTIGHRASSDASRTTVIGPEASAEERNGLSIGNEATANGELGVSIGPFSETNEESVSLGDNATTTGVRSVAIGSRAETTAGSQNYAIGRDATVSDTHAIAIGTGSTASGRSSIAIGEGVTTQADNTARIGFEDVGAVFQIDEDGNLEITGSITENATL